MQTLFAHRSLRGKIKEFYDFFLEHKEDRDRRTTEQLMDAGTVLYGGADGTRTRDLWLDRPVC